MSKKAYNESASKRLFSEYQKFDKGQITSEQFITNVESSGMPVTPQFQAYVRQTKDSNDCQFAKVQQTLNCHAPARRNVEYVPPVNPYDQKFHRGTQQPMAKVDSTRNVLQDEMSQAIRAYSGGKMNVTDFKNALADNEIKIDNKLDTLIRRHESGDTIKYNEFGKQIYMQLNGAEIYNRVDKINMNNPKIVGAEKTGKSFGFNDEIDTKRKRALDNEHQSQQTRYTGGTYVPKKGSGGFQQNNQLASSMTNVINQEKAKFSGATQEYKTTFKQVNNKERQGNSTMLSWENHDDSKGSSQAYQDFNASTKKSNASHPAQQTNGNFLLWN